jgi:hypothetical protein
MSKATTLRLPPGSDEVAAWARQARVAHQPCPNHDWFGAWEPFDTMISPSGYFNSVAFAVPLGSITIAEPWYAALDSEPLDRTLLSFVTHPAFRRHAAARGGEFFNTRVSYLENPPPPRVEIGDPAWDRHFLSFAASASEAAAAFSAPARNKLAAWRFAGHIEVRPGGLILHFAGLAPVPHAYDWLFRHLPELVEAWFRKK